MRLFEGDCLSVLKGLPDNSVDSIVTDPPYGLSFMGKKWDYEVPSVKIWRECLRVLKSGGHLLAFAGSRTYHRMAVNIEDAGFEIRDQIMWVYGSGFPKSHNISKAIDKAAGAEREVIGERVVRGLNSGHLNTSGGSLVGSVVEDKVSNITKPATPEAQQWEGWGSALKPAHEPIVVARKPLIGTIVENVLEHGTGGLNIDESRTEGGRFPANFIHDGSDEVVSLFPESARFFYCAKASQQEKHLGLEGEDLNIHPTVKPVDLMKYLCRLVTPPEGLVLDPFMGSGTTGIAAKVEGFDFIGIEMDAEYLEIAEARIGHWVEEVETTYKSLYEWV